MPTRKLTSNEVVDEVTEALRHGDEELLAQVANMVMPPEYTYDADSGFFLHELED